MDPSPVLVLAWGLPSGGEWIFIFLICLLIFGSRLPAVMRSLGGSIKEFKKGMEDGPEPKAGGEPPRIDGTVAREGQPPVQAPPPPSVPPEGRP